MNKKMNSTFKSIIVIPLLAMFFSVSSFLPAAKAAVIETEIIFNLQSQSAEEKVSTFLARDDVKQQMIHLGVDPVDAQNRVATMSHEELAQIQQHIDNLPAGAGVFAVLGVVFLVLLILELVGVTNVFSRL